MIVFGELSGWAVFMLPPLYKDLDVYYDDIDKWLAAHGRTEGTVLIDSVWVDGQGAPGRFSAVPYKAGRLVRGGLWKLLDGTPEMMAALEFERAYFERQ